MKTNRRLLTITVIVLLGLVEQQQQLKNGLVFAEMNRAEALMHICLETFGKEMKEGSSETCVVVDKKGPGIRTPPGAARLYAACGAAMHEALALCNKRVDGYEPSSQTFTLPDGVNNIESLNAAITFSLYQVMGYILPGRANYVAQRIFDSFGLNVTTAEQPNKTLRFAYKVGSLAGSNIVNLLKEDGSNQKNCYADNTGYIPLNGLVNLDDANTIVASNSSVKSILRWSDIRFKGKIPARPFLMPHAGFQKTRTPPIPIESTPPISFNYSAIIAQMIQLSDAQKTLMENNHLNKAIADYWADGPGSYFPPGHWQYLVLEYYLPVLKLGIVKTIKLISLTSAAVHEASVAAWLRKRVYDTARPATLIPLALHNETLTNQYRGPYCEFGNIKGSQWRPYQLESFWTPPFPGYPSGHATFSATVARVIERFMKSANIPKGPVTIPVKKGSSLIEPHCFANKTTFTGAPCNFIQCAFDNTKSSENYFSPPQDIQLGPYTTVYDWANEAASSRELGGIHPKVDNNNGLELGLKLGDSVFDYMCSKYFKNHGCHL